MVKAAAAAGHLDERAAALESLTAIRRAGAEVVVSYWTKELARVALVSGAREVELVAQSHEVDPRRRQLAGAGDALGRARRAGLRARRRGRLDRGRGRQPLRRLGDVLGAASLRARRRGDPRRRRGRAGARHDVRSADRGRGGAGGRDRRRGAVGRDGPSRLLRHGGGDERVAARACVHPPRPRDQVRRLLPRARRSVPRRGRLGSGHARDPVEPGCPARCHRRHDRVSVQRHRPRWPRPSRSTAKGWRRSSSSRSPATWASSRPSPASSRRCDGSATRPARCSSSTR